MGVSVCVASHSTINSPTGVYMQDDELPTPTCEVCRKLCSVSIIRQRDVDSAYTRKVISMWKALNQSN